MQEKSLSIAADRAYCQAICTSARFAINSPAVTLCHQPFKALGGPTDEDANQMGMAQLLALYSD